MTIENQVQEKSKRKTKKDMNLDEWLDFSIEELQKRLKVQKKEREARNKAKEGEARANFLNKLMPLSLLNPADFPISEEKPQTDFQKLYEALFAEVSEWKVKADLINALQNHLKDKINFEEFSTK